jgi:ATP-dependent helicase/nuclease subunit B
MVRGGEQRRDRLGAAPAAAGPRAAPGGRLAPESAPPGLFVIPYHQDPLAHLARHLLDSHRARLPDLSGVTVLLPSPLASARLRRRLLQEARCRGQAALLGPAISTLTAWATERIRLDLPILAEQARELALIEALLEHPAIVRQATPWSLARDLLALFDELTLQRVSLPAELGELIARLQHGYAVGDTVPPPLSQEAQLVFTLWHAWHDQLQGEGRLDVTAAYVTRLALSLETVEPERQFYLAGFHRLSPPEREWIQALLRRGQAQLILHGQVGRPDTYHPDAPLAELCQQLHATPPPQGAMPPLTRFLDAVYAGEGPPLAQRAAAFAQAVAPSPIADTVRVFAADDAEQEARAVDVAVRRWLLLGCRQIGIVTQDRRLARRLRALLERADVTLADAAGWALSTTNAAAALQRWLQVVEQDFPYGPLLDLLKSAFVFPERDRAAHLAAVQRLEQGVIRQGSITCGIARYRRYLRSQEQRRGAADTAVHELLSGVQQAARPLLRLLKGKRRYAPQAYLMALRESLDRLGLGQGLQRDPAGQRVLAELERLLQALGGRRLRLSWVEFRAWLGQTLERFHYRPAADHDLVQLLSLEQTPLCRFDAVVIAGLGRDHAPGPGLGSPFFNDRVRRELGLLTSRAIWSARFHHFRRLLESAPRVLLTVPREEAGEPVVPCPWLERLQTFHRLAYGHGLHDEELRQLVAHPATAVVRADTPALPQVSTRPAPVLQPGLLPQTLTPGAYQDLVDCPYRFYARRCLGLTAPAQVREALEKADYGQRLHRCLEAFHGGLPELPAPFREPLDAAHREAAIARLEAISQAVFARDLDANFLHRGWLQRWRQVIPDYIDWQIDRGRAWHFASAEVETQMALTPGVRLQGRIDRIDQGVSGWGIIDYKTGSTPAQDAIDSGEAVQLPCYALLAAGPVTAAEYLRLDPRGLRQRIGLQGAQLQALAAQTGTRLIELVTAMRQGAPLPAWGSPEVCERCELSGVCRHQSWADAPIAP